MTEDDKNRMALLYPNIPLSVIYSAMAELDRYGAIAVDNLFELTYYGVDPDQFTDDAMKPNSADEYREDDYYDAYYDPYPGEDKEDDAILDEGCLRG